MIMLKLDKAKLDARVALAKFDGYDDVADAARKRGLKLSSRTIYNMVSGENWSREKLEALCSVLNCQPADIVIGWQSNGGGDLHTHGAPQLAQELETATQ